MQDNILRQLRKLPALPLRNETTNFIVQCDSPPSPFTMNRVVALDPGLALALVRLTGRASTALDLTVAKLARLATLDQIFQLIDSGICIADTDQSYVPMVSAISDHSLLVGYTARVLARQQRYPHPEVAYLAGLLHNVGLLAASVVAPEQVSTVLQGQDDSLLTCERELWGTDHLVMARRLGDRWSLPLWLRNVIWWHQHDVDGIPNRLAHRELVLLVAEAQREVARMGFGLGSDEATRSQLPWDCKDAIRTEVVRGLRQARTTLHELAPEGLAESSLEKGLKRAQGHSRVVRGSQWVVDAVDKWTALGDDPSYSELCELVAVAAREALNAEATLCCLRSSDQHIEGLFASDRNKTLEWQGEPGGDSTRITAAAVNSLAGVWQKRPYRKLELHCDHQVVGVLLVWLDEFSWPAAEQSAAQLVAMAERWIQPCYRGEELQQQVESLANDLREVVSNLKLRSEQAKLEAMAELAAGAGHEINNPLAIISGRSQLLQSEESDERKRKYLETISHQAQRIHRMIVDLMAFARPPEPQMETLRLPELLGLICESVASQCAQRGIQLHCSSVEDLPAVWADRNLLNGALECVVQNAIEAVGEDGNVRISGAANGDGEVDIFVSDDGPGLSEEARLHMFEPFYSGRDAGRGLGLGLSKAWRIMRLLGGNVELHSESNGTTFRLTVPELPSDPQQRACA